MYKNIIHIIKKSLQLTKDLFKYGNNLHFEI